MPGRVIRLCCGVGNTGRLTPCLFLFLLEFASTVGLGNDTSDKTDHFHEDSLLIPALISLAWRSFLLTQTSRCCGAGNRLS